MDNNSKYHFLKENSFLILCVFFFALFVVIAAISGAWPGKDISAQFFSALAGALVAAIITLFLLRGQTAVEADRKKSSKVFEEKLKIYQDFLHKLCDVVKDMKIMKEEEIELEFQVAYIAMHTSSESIMKISDKVAGIIVSIKEGKDNGEERLRQLFEIADLFYYELYGKDNPVDANIRNTTLGNFLSISNNDIKVYDKIRLIKNLVKSNGTIQSIMNDNTLVHELYTDYDKEKGIFINSNNRIVVSLKPVDNKYFDLIVYARLNNEEKSHDIADGLGEKFENPASHLYKRIPMNTSNEEIASIMKDLLAKIKAYRDKIYPLK